MKEGRFKKYWERVEQYRQNKTFQKNEENFTSKKGEITRKHTNNRMRGKQFWSKICQPKEHNKKKKAKWISNIGKELEGLEKGPKAKILIDSLRTTLKDTKLEHQEIQEKTLGKYWKLILSNKWRWKKNFKKNISRERESYAKQNYIAGTL